MAAEMLTREEMEQVIREGGAVAHQNRLLTRIEDLPDEIELAQGDQERMANATAAIDRQIAELTAQRARAVADADQASKGKQQGAKSKAGQQQGMIVSAAPQTDPNSSQSAPPSPPSPTPDQQQSQPQQGV